MYNYFLPLISKIGSRLSNCIQNTHTKQLYIISGWDNNLKFQKVLKNNHEPVLNLENQEDPTQMEHHHKYLKYIKRHFKGGLI